MACFISKKVIFSNSNEEWQYGRTTMGFTIPRQSLGRRDFKILCTILNEPVATRGNMIDREKCFAYSRLSFTAEEYFEC